MKQAATRARQRRRMSVRGTDLDEIESQFDRLEADHGRKSAVSARELALAYLSAVVGEALHAAETFKAVLSNSHKQLRKTLVRRKVPEVEWDEDLADADRRSVARASGTSTSRSRSTRRSHWTRLAISWRARS